MSQAKTTQQSRNTGLEPDVSRAPSSRQIPPTSSRQLLQRAQVASESLTHADIHRLQRTIGNQATGRLLTQRLSIQTKLQVGPADDKYEREADRTAQQVLGALADPTRPTVQREEISELAVSRVSRYISAISAEQSREAWGPTRTFGVPKAQRKEMDDELAQAAPNHGLEGGEVESGVAQDIQRAKGSGSALDPKTRYGMESAFGADFAGVRVHTGTKSDAINRSLNARAFTTGNDIFFRKGEYNPGSTGGKELLAHELTHTVQQGAAPVRRQTALDGEAGRETDVLEPKLQPQGTEQEGLLQGKFTTGSLSIHQTDTGTIQRNISWDDANTKVNDALAGATAKGALKPYTISFVVPYKPIFAPESVDGVFLAREIYQDIIHPKDASHGLWTLPYVAESAKMAANGDFGPPTSTRGGRFTYEAPDDNGRRVRMVLSGDKTTIVTMFAIG